jgi:hypothetical protein
MVQTLNTEDRQRVWRALQRYWSKTWDTGIPSKTILQTTVNETDTWFSDNQADYLTALTYDSDFTGAQLVLLFGITALMRKDNVDLIERALTVSAEA